MKPIYILTAMLLTIGVCSGSITQTDLIYGVYYNGSYIETANFAWIQVLNHESLQAQNISLYMGQNIIVLGLEYTSNETATATIITKEMN